jgi:hypothetical protein
VFHIFMPLTCYLVMVPIIGILVSFGVQVEDLGISTLYLNIMQVYIIVFVIRSIKRRMT